MVARKNERLGKRLVNPVNVRKFWNLKGKISSGLGTAGHDFCVAWWLDRDEIVPNTELERNAEKLMKVIDSKFDIIRMEVPRGSKKYAMGYTIDILLKDKVTKKYYIGDFKFSRAFTSEQFKADKGRLPNRMNDILKEFRDVGHDKGIIQLNMYAKFMEEEGINIEGAYLFHIDGLKLNRDFKGYYKDGFKVYKVKMMPKLIETMLRPQEQYAIVDTLVDAETMSKL